MKISNEAKIGVLVTIVVAALAVLTWKAGNFEFNPGGYELNVVFKDIEGVQLNAPVTLNGFEVGRVQDIHMIYRGTPKVKVVLWIKQNVKVPVDAVVHVKNMGFLGEKYVAILTGDKVTRFLPPGATLKGEQPSSLENLMKEGDAIAKNLREISGQINDRLKANSGAIDSIMRNLNKTMDNFASISTRVNDILTRNDTSINSIFHNLDGTTANLEEMSSDLKKNPWKLLYKPRGGGR